jgi:hypothetical protein
MHVAARKAVAKQTMLELIATSEEKSVWENGHLDKWKNRLFMINPHQLADDMILIALFKEAPPAYDDISTDPLANLGELNIKEQDALTKLLSMFETDHTLADANTVERIKAQLRRKPTNHSSDAVVPSRSRTGRDQGEMDRCYTWDTDSDNGEIQIAALQF